MKESKTFFTGKNYMSSLQAGRAARVQAIKEAIAAGTYKVDDGSLADSLLRDLLWKQWEIKQLSKP